MDTKSKIYLKWEEIEWLVNYLVQQILESGEQIDSIFGLPRGGLIPAVMLSHKLDLPLVFEPTPTTLIVDDICDSGKTFRELFISHPDNMFASLHYKPEVSEFEPDFYGNEIREDIWLVYPWEREDADAIQDYLKK